MILKEGYVVKVKNKNGTIDYLGTRTSSIYVWKTMAEKEADLQNRIGRTAEVITARVIVDDDEGKQNERTN